MAAITALSEYPDRIRRLFLSKEPNKQCLFALRICVYGTWEVVFLDDWFAVDPYSGYSSAFSCTTNNQIWLMLLLKAWAKVFGGYLNISGGTCLEALTDLTGAPALHLDVSSVIDEDIEHNWTSLIEAAEKQYTACVSAKKFAQVDEERKDPITGIITDHCYAFVDCYEIIFDSSLQQFVTKDKGYAGDAETLRIVKLRNPWGESGYKKDWLLQNRQKISPKLLSRMLGLLATQSTAKPRSILFVDYREFGSLFSGLDICLFHPANELSSCRLESPDDKPTMLSFQIQQKGVYYISLHQISARAFKDSESKFLVIRILVLAFVSCCVPITPSGRYPAQGDAQEENQGHVAGN